VILPQFKNNTTVENDSEIPSSAKAT
jgi:hypothetical protein